MSVTNHEAFYVLDGPLYHGIELLIRTYFTPIPAVVKPQGLTQRPDRQNCSRPSESSQCLQHRQDAPQRTLIELRNFAVDLQAELARKDIEIAANVAEIHAKTLHIEKLKMQLAVLRRARFGRSSEKLDHAIEQLELLIGELEADASAAEARDTGALDIR